MASRLFLRARRGLARRATVGEAESSEDVQANHRPAEGAEVVVDLVHEATVTPASIGRARLVDAPPLTATAVQHDLDRRVARKGALGVFEKLLAVARDDEDLLGRLAMGVVAALGLGRPALGEGVELGQHLERPLVEELGEEDPGISATREA